MFQYFSEIAQNPESNRRLEGPPGPAVASAPVPAKSPWPASVCSSSSRESSPFSSKTSDSTRDSVYGHNKEYARGGRVTPQPAGRQQAMEEPENIYATIGPPSSHKGDRLSSCLSIPPAPSHSSLDHVYSAVPAMAGSSATLSSTSDTTGSNTATARSRDSLDSDSSILAGFGQEKPDEKEPSPPSQSSILANFHAQLNKIKQECDVVKLPPEPEKPPEPPSQASILAGFTAQLNKIRRDCEIKEEFMKSTAVPAYMSSPPRETDRNPYRIASLAATMPPAPPPKEPSPGKDLFKPFN